jgi:hypothetical protein
MPGTSQIFDSIIGQPPPHLIVITVDVANNSPR